MVRKTLLSVAAMTVICIWSVSFSTVYTNLRYRLAKGLDRGMLLDVAARKEVFISATSADLGSYRQVVKEALHTLGVHPVEESNFPTDYRKLQDLLARRLDPCDAVIHLVGFHYGGEPKVAQRNSAQPELLTEGRSRDSQGGAVGVVDRARHEEKQDDGVAAMGRADVAHYDADGRSDGISGHGGRRGVMISSFLLFMGKKKPASTSKVVALSRANDRHSYAAMVHANGL